MNDHCTPATAARLKAAGFPQPAPEFGQAWYIDNGALFLVVETFEANPEPFNGVWVIEKGGEVQYVERSVFDDMIFAPGVADLLRELPGYDIGYYTALDGGPAFVVIDDFSKRVAGSQSPAEDLAAAWLELNEKK